MTKTKKIIKDLVDYCEKGTDFTRHRKLPFSKMMSQKQHYKKEAGHSMPRLLFIIVQIPQNALTTKIISPQILNLMGLKTCWQ